jgi:hypothetical protein
MDPYRTRKIDQFSSKAPILKKIMWMLSGKYLYMKYIRRTLKKPIVINSEELQWIAFACTVLAIVSIVGYSIYNAQISLNKEHIVVAEAAHTADTVWHQFCQSTDYKSFVLYNEDCHMIKCANHQGDMKEFFCEGCVESDKELKLHLNIIRTHPGLKL